MAQILNHPATRRTSSPVLTWSDQRPVVAVLAALVACCLSFGTSWGVTEAFTSSAIERRLRLRAGQHVIGRAALAEHPVHAQMMAELVIGQPKRGGRTLLVEAVRGQGLAQQAGGEGARGLQEAAVRQRLAGAGRPGQRGRAILPRAGERVEHHVLERPFRTFGARHTALDDVAELAHVARPVVAGERPLGGPGETREERAPQPRSSSGGRNAPRAA